MSNAKINGYLLLKQPFLLNEDKQKKSQDTRKRIGFKKDEE
jgi:hypothetical protein